MRVGFLLGVSFGYLGCVDCSPFVVASDFWRNFWTSYSVSPGHEERKLFLIADISVDVHGLHITRLRKVRRSAFDFDSYKLPAKWRSGSLNSVIFSFCLGVRGTM